jgi:Kef-type K+ transport system membrane component KefB
MNLSKKSGEVFSLISSYFEELIFIIFFVLAGAHLRFDTLASSWVWVLAFVVLRAVGKFSGTFLGSNIAGAEPKVKKFTAYGLLPQGGIVVGLALLARQDPHFQAFGTILVSLILGTTVIHEFLGPLLSKFAISRAGEMGKE